MHLGNVQAVIMADCNYLKQTNDTKGHEFGDMLLQSVADGIKAVLPEKCIAMRVGGDEIFMVCPHTSKVLVQKMKEQMVKRSDEILQVSVSFGISTVENGEATFEEAYEAAHQEMYKEKMASQVGRE